jgi:DNA-binding MarR family transcriptional regulator
LSSTSDSELRLTTANDQEREPAEVAALWSAELPDLDLNPFLVSGTIMRLAQRLERVFTATARARGVGPGELRILLALRRSGPRYALSPTALFRSLMITSGAVSKQVDRLAELGLVARAADPDVLRGILIQLRPAGREMAEDAMREICSANGGLENLSDGNARTVLRALSLVSNVLDEAEHAEEAR